MDSTISNLPILNNEQLEMLCLLDEENKVDLLKGLLDAFIKTWEDNKNALKENYDNKNLEGIRKTVHLFAGSSSNIGIHRFSQVCRAIEKDIHEQKPIDFESNYKDISNEYMLAIKTMTEYISSLK